MNPVRKFTMFNLKTKETFILNSLTWSIGLGLIF